MSRLTKRLFDVVIALAGLILVAPFLLIAALLLLLLEGRPIFYRSRRCNRPDSEIVVFKFRSMVKDATDPKYQLEKRFMRSGYLDIPPDANVYTPIGRVLERTQLVETPQLLSVLLGDMSLIGNRPLPKKNVEMFRGKPCWRERFDSPAGITGISQVVGKHNLSPDERLRLEVMYSRVYQDGWVLLCDLYIIYRTILLVLFNRTLPVAQAIDFMKLCGGAVPPVLHPHQVRYTDLSSAADGFKRRRVY